jgi:hypothetical protein
LTPNEKIYNIFRGRELTYFGKDGTWVLDSYDPEKSIPLDSEFCEYMVDKYKYLQADSGNTYTGEIHYRISDTDKLKYISYQGDLGQLDKIHREIFIDRLLK